MFYSILLSVGKNASLLHTKYRWSPARGQRRRNYLSQELRRNFFRVSAHTQLKNLGQAVAPAGSFVLRRGGSGRKVVGRTDCSAALCFCRPAKCSVTFSRWTGQLLHLLQITEPKYGARCAFSSAGIWRTELLCTERCWACVSSPSPGSSWVSAIFQVHHSLGIHLNLSQIGLWASSFLPLSKAHHGSSWARAWSQTNQVFLCHEHATLLRYHVPRNGSRLYGIKTLWLFSFYLCSQVSKCLVWLPLNVVFLEWK